MNDQQASLTVEIKNPEGMHARPADLFAKCAGQFRSAVTVSKPGIDPVDAKSILSLLTLGAAQGTQLTIEAKGVDAQTAVKQLEKLVGSDFDASLLDSDTQVPN